MFVKGTRRWFTKSGEQRAEGSFLLLCLPDKPAEKLIEVCRWVPGTRSNLSPDQGRVAWRNKDGTYTDEICGTEVPLWPGERGWCPKCEGALIGHTWHAPFDGIRARVKRVKLTQFGHFMMGKFDYYTISGSYGSDGLPIDVTRVYWEESVPVPAELIEIYRNGGGHNSCGREGPAMLKWALENLSRLRRC